MTDCPFDHKELQSDIAEKSLMEVKDDAQKCMHSAVDYLSRREHSLLELRQKLAKKDYHEDIIENTLVTLLEKDYLSNLRYAEMLIKTRQMQGYGNRYISQELHSKGVETETVNLVDSDLISSKAWQLAFDIALRKKCRDNTRNIKIDVEKLASLSNEDKVHLVFKEKQKVTAYLARRGFDIDVIASSLRVVNFKVVS